MDCQAHYRSYKRGVAGDDSKVVTQVEQKAAHHRKIRHRMTRHRMIRHRMPCTSNTSLYLESRYKHNTNAHLEKKHIYVNSNSTLPDSTPQSLVRRETRPPSKERSANKTSLEPKPHPGKRTHKRGKRSQIAIISHKCGRRYRRSINRREYRRVRQCWKALAKLPYTLSEAQERILAEERFRHISLENQFVNDQHNEREAGNSETQEAKTSTTPTTKSNTINRTIRIATFNVRGMNFITGRQQILYLMEKHNLDILALQETHINYTGKEIHDNYAFYFSSNIDDEKRKQVDAQLDEYNNKVKKDKIPPDIAQRERMRIRQKSTEKLGCAIVYRRSPYMEIEIAATNNKIISLSINDVPIRINILATHAPHAGHTKQDKATHYDSLTQQISGWKRHDINVVMGDFNARLIEQLPGENRSIGKHIYRNDASTIEQLSETQKHNRQLFTEFALTHDLIVMNTWLEKPVHKLATYRGPTTQQFSNHNINTDTHAQMDYIMINDTWKNSIQNVDSIQTTLLDSDHALIIADLKVKFATKKKAWRLKQQTNKYRQPKNVQQASYNSEVQRQLQDEIAKPTWDPALAFESFSGISQKAADKCLTKIPVSMKKHYLTEKTWQLIEEKQTALENGDFEKAKSLKKEIRKHARIDKEKSLVQELEEIDRDGYKWDG